MFFDSFQTELLQTFLLLVIYKFISNSLLLIKHSKQTYQKKTLTVYKVCEDYLLNKKQIKINFYF